MPIRDNGKSKICLESQRRISELSCRRPILVESMSKKSAAVHLFRLAVKLRSKKSVQPIIEMEGQYSYSNLASRISVCYQRAVPSGSDE